jgi:hypothetical protein
MSLHPLDEALLACVNGNLDGSEKILREYPDQSDLRIIFNLGWHEARHGNLNKGLQMMDAGRFLNVYGGNCLPGTIWRNENLKGRTLLFNCENGLGDQIMDVRFARDFKEKGANVVVACAPELMSFFAKNGFICVNINVASQVYYDYWIPAMSAAHVLGYDSDNFPGKPYLTSKKRELFAPPGNLKIGIRWSGNPAFEHEQHRRFDPKPLFDLHKLNGVSLYSLQRDDNLIDGLPFTDLRDQLKTFEDTAEIIQGLDLVITSCTSVAHLSAALGKKTWIIVPVMPYFPWSAPGNTSVWYDSVTLFKQKVYGNWDVPLNEVRNELESLLQMKVAA